MTTNQTRTFVLPILRKRWTTSVFNPDGPTGNLPGQGMIRPGVHTRIVDLSEVEARVLRSREQVDDLADAIRGAVSSMDVASQFERINHIEPAIAWPRR